MPTPPPLFFILLNWCSVSLSPSNKFFIHFSVDRQRGFTDSLVYANTFVKKIDLNLWYFSVINLSWWLLQKSTFLYARFPNHTWRFLLSFVLMTLTNNNYCSSTTFYSPKPWLWMKIFAPNNKHSFFWFLFVCLFVLFENGMDCSRNKEYPPSSSPSCNFIKLSSWLVLSLSVIIYFEIFSPKSIFRPLDVDVAMQWRNKERSGFRTSGGWKYSQAKSL